MMLNFKKVDHWVVAWPKRSADGAVDDLKIGLLRVCVYVFVSE